MATQDTDTIQVNYSNLENDISQPKEAGRNYFIIGCIMMALLFGGTAIVAVLMVTKNSSHSIRDNGNITARPSISNITSSPTHSPSICNCYGSANNCCCYGEDNSCDEGLLCDPDTKLCIESSDLSPVCGYNGQFISCTLSGESGVITGACGSGTDADCALYSGCESEVGYTAINCDYQDLGVYNRPNTDWICGESGEELSCIGESSGEIMIGICGSGKNEDCVNPCTGTAAILCNSVGDLSIDTSMCEWQSQSETGHFLRCPNDYIATGYCGSAANKDCNGAVFQLQCCKMNYS